MTSKHIVKIRKSKGWLTKLNDKVNFTLQNVSAKMISNKISHIIKQLFSLIAIVIVFLFVNVSDANARCIPRCVLPFRCDTSTNTCKILLKPLFSETSTSALAEVNISNPQSVPESELMRPRCNPPCVRPFRCDTSSGTCKL
jgi:hypothetical protein